MKELVQTFLIGGGIIGLLVTVPLAVFIWCMRGFASPDEGLFFGFFCFGLPVLCLACLIGGLRWRRKDGDIETQKEEA
ncbi:MAG: hypothetical protein QM790_16465 [Nibricoccus sp.]